MENRELINMINIHKWFGALHVLKGVNFTVRCKEVVGLVGDNGAGKSTLIKILSGYHKPDEGEIWFNGRRVIFNSPKEARMLGIETVYQDQALAPHLTVARNVFLGREVVRSMGFVDAKKIKEESMKALEKIGLNLRSSDLLINFLSGGERQGVALARALYFGARLIVLDEPTASLSIKECQKVLEFVKSVRDAGLSVIFVTHNLYHVCPIADRFVVLSRGEKIADVKKEETSIEELTKLIIS
ncbi:MAG: ATP-binding cassette domain-containing protein [Candidatus Omnitrophica bacterium]|nr:ATP-binding cassette domain-containing protein [Candidatus Omnitrophota bacterium]